MDEQIEPNQIEADIRHEAWGGITDPREHQDNRFRYLVYAFNPSAAIDQRIVSVAVAQAGLETRQKDSLVDLLKNPEGIAQRDSLSLSLIDENHRATWGSFGLIVEVPKPNVILVSASDIGSIHASIDLLKQQAQQHPPISGNQLLANSSPDNYNEVVTLGKSEYGKIKVIGFFAKVDEEGYLDQSQVWRLKQHAERLNLPFVKIKAENPFEEEEIDVKPQKEGIYVNHLGKRYILRSGYKREFVVMNSRREEHFMSPTEADDIFRFLESRIATGETAMELAVLYDLRKEYELIDKARKTPTFEYDTNHNVKGFHFYTGYGNQEIEYQINQHGAHRINTARRKAEMKKSLLEGDSYTMPIDISHYQVRVSPEEIEKILQEVSVFADPKVIETARKFISTHRANIQDAYQKAKSLGSYAKSQISLGMLPKELLDSSRSARIFLGGIKDNKPKDKT
ncbi:hypothetical protein M1615_04510 [Patescibacteria group bacterium]|nr:hypothetical protein [Patescibacteria group bacterium]